MRIRLVARRVGGLFAACASLLALAACGPTEAGFSGRVLPVAYSDAWVSIDCFEPGPLPSFEAWAGAADVMLFGTVVRLEPLWEPAVVPINDAYPPYVSRDECSGHIEPGLRVVLEELDVLLGDSPGEELTLSFCTNFAFEMYPHPFRDTSGSIRWTPAGAPGRIEPGQRIGGVLYRDPDWNVWGPQKNGGVLLQLDAQDVLRVQEYENEGCIRAAPAEVAGMTLEEFRARLTSMDLSDPTTQAEIASRRMWGEDLVSRLDYYWGARCFPAIECEFDVDCDPGEVCRGGECQPECFTDADCQAGELCINSFCRAP